MSNKRAELLQNETPKTHSSTCSQEVQRGKIVHGKLFATTVYLRSLDLDKPEFIVGRSHDCDVVITPNNYSTLCIHTLSAYHFKITCQPDASNVSLLDLSKNGTFVNSRRVGKDNRVTLKHNDFISIGTPDYKIYIYKKTDIDHDEYLPSELKDKYEFKSLLGDGAFGEVLLVRELSAQKEYAIKKINKGKLCDKDNLNNPLRIKNEVNVMLSLSHPCIITAKEIIENDEAVFVVFEYMAGGELTNLLESSTVPLPENVVKSLFYQMVLGLRYLHLRNITHRDLKPSNILLQSNSATTIVKLADFGLNKITNTNSDLNRCYGTPRYFSPEIIDPRYGPYTQQVDVWSLGVILFYMLSKELPFQVPNNRLSDILRLIIFGTYNMSSKVWKSVSDDAKDLIMKMLVKNPEERYTIHEVASHSWLEKDKRMQEQVEAILANSTKESKQVRRDSCDELPSSKKLKVE